MKAPLSLLQRKLSNVLLLNAYEELPDPNVKEHEIPVRVLAEVAGYDSKDFAYLRDALRALVDCRVEWNVLGENGEEDEWAAASLLAQAKTKGGVCRYVYAPDLREKLYRPEVYARINLAIQARFGSGYALALYENCARFRKVGTTGWIALETWRDLLGVGEEQYPAFKALRQKVLSPAIKEVNEFSDVRVEMETRREKRRIVALKFVVSEAPPHEPGMAAKGLGLREALGAEGVPDARSAAPEPAEVIEDHPLAELQRRLLAFGLTEAQALDLSTEFPEARVAANLDHVEAEVARGLEPGGREVKNVAAFTVAAVRGDYAKGAATPDVVRKASEKKQEAASAAQAKQERTAAQQGGRGQGQALGRGASPAGARRGVVGALGRRTGRLHRTGRRAAQGRSPTGPPLVRGGARRGEGRRRDAPGRPVDAPVVPVRGDGEAPVGPAVIAGSVASHLRPQRVKGGVEHRAAQRDITGLMPLAWSLPRPSRTRESQIVPTLDVSPDIDQLRLLLSDRKK